MAILRFINLTIKDAEYLADLTGIFRDIETTVNICDILIELLKNRPTESVLLEALMGAALVRYVRVFSKGTRCTLPHSILSDLSPKLRKYHKVFKDIRDKYVAHSVNAFEENQVVAYLMPEDGGLLRATSISVQEKRLVSLGVTDIQKLKELCNALVSSVCKMITEENSRVLKLARSMPFEALYSQVAPPVRDFDIKEAGRGRKRL
jgi:hypothetical protein